MKKLLSILLAMLVLTACGQNKENKQEAIYMNITAQEAKKIMDTEQDYIVLDTRTQEETSNTGAVLDGDIDRFINAYLRMGANKAGRVEEA